MYYIIGSELGTTKLPRANGNYLPDFVKSYQSSNTTIHFDTLKPNEHLIV